MLFDTNGRFLLLKALRYPSHVRMIDPLDTTVADRRSKTNSVNRRGGRYGSFVHHRISRIRTASELIKVYMNRSHVFPFVL